MSSTCLSRHPLNMSNTPSLTQITLSLAPLPSTTFNWPVCKLICFHFKLIISDNLKPESKNNLIIVLFLCGDRYLVLKTSNNFCCSSSVKISGIFLFTIILPPFSLKCDYTPLLYQIGGYSLIYLAYTI